MGDERRGLSNFDLSIYPKGPFIAKYSLIKSLAILPVSRPKHKTKRQRILDHNPRDFHHGGRRHCARSGGFPFRRFAAPFRGRMANPLSCCDIDGPAVRVTSGSPSCRTVCRPHPLLRRHAIPRPMTPSQCPPRRAWPAGAPSASSTTSSFDRTLPAAVGRLQTVSSFIHMNI